MRTISQYQEDIKALMKSAADLDAQAQVEDRDLTEAELTIKNDILDRVEEYKRTVETLKRQEKLAADLAKPEPAVAHPSTAKKEPKIEVGIDRKSKEKFSSLGEQLAAVMNASRSGGRIDPRLYNATGLGETIPSDGGFLVQTDFSNELLQQVYKTGILAPMCRRIQISGNANSVKINGIDETSRSSTRHGGTLAYWIDEAASKTASKPKFRQIELSLNKLIGLCYATDEMLADSSLLESVIRDSFASEFGFRIDDAIINGIGAGQPLGILNSGCLVSVTAETGQAATTIVAENLFKMYSRMFPQSLGRAVWLINQDVQPQLFGLSLAVGTGGGPIYMPAGGLSQAPYGTLFGRPVIPIEQCATLGTVGDIIFADLGGYILAEKGGIKSDMSIHVNFTYDESVFRFVLRVDGQPERSTALTPYKGSNTLSHFVALASRT